MGWFCVCKKIFELNLRWINNLSFFYKFKQITYFIYFKYFFFVNFLINFINKNTSKNLDFDLKIMDESIDHFLT